ncbi:MAG: aldehyde dehydrogenase [Mesorhizobium sp.]|nr:MAG: aldehyde dehydrogenase [Mesorhizobium sp.]
MNNLSLRQGLKSATDWLSEGPKQLYVGGEWRAPADGGKFFSINPATDEQIAEISAAGPEDVEIAARAATEALDNAAWSEISPHSRADFLLELSRLVLENREQLAVLESLDMGAPICLSAKWIENSARTLRYYAGWATKVFGETLPSDGERFMYTLREPVGVCGLITPWNTPFLQAINKIAPALAFANTCIVKPSEVASLSTIRLFELIDSIGLPRGVASLLTGKGSIVGGAMVRSPLITKVVFTGSSEVGRQIYRDSGASMRKLTLELGGKSPNIIFPDADLDKAVTAAVAGFCRNSGQVCSAGSRILVYEDIMDDFAERLAVATSQQVVGEPLDVRTQVGPLASRTQLETVQAHLEQARREPGSKILGGDGQHGVGCYITPAIVVGLANDAALARQEIFGPVTMLMPFRSEEEAVKMANDTEFGLASAIWTNDLSRAHRLSKRLRSGRVWINTYAEVDQVLPLGGTKNSGIGRELGHAAIETYTEMKSVLMRL